MKVNIFALTLVGMLRGGTSAPLPVAYSIETVAGSSQVGDGGSAKAAALSDADRVTTDAAGNVFVAMRTITASERSPPMKPFPPSPATVFQVFAATAAQRPRRVSALHMAWQSIALATYLLPI